MTYRPDIDKVIADLERQLADLRKESSRLSASLAEKTGSGIDDLRDLARSAYGDASRGMHRASRYARREGSQLADVIRENPTTASTATIAAAGLIGIGLWWLLRSDR